MKNYVRMPCSKHKEKLPKHSARSNEDTYIALKTVMSHWELRKNSTRVNSLCSKRYVVMKNRGQKFVKWFKRLLYKIIMFD